MLAETEEVMEKDDSGMVKSGLELWKLLTVNSDGSPVSNVITVLVMIRGMAPTKTIQEVLRTCQVMVHCLCARPS